jgi:hypothetical protein
MALPRSKIDARIATFRRLALSLPGAAESSHMGHPDFRLDGRVFATLFGQEKGCGVVKLTPEQQESFVAEQPNSFSPVQGGWGRRGMTFVHLHEADETLIAGALSTAHHNLQKKLSPKKSVKSSSPSAKQPGPSRRRLQ